MTEATITKILTKPKLKNGKWVIVVVADCREMKGRTESEFTSKEEAERVSVGDIILV